jgi:hypothetical protein
MYPNKGWASTQPYEYSDYNSSDEQSPTFDSYTIPEDDLELGQSRLLEVDNRVVVPAKTPLRMIVTSADVLHSWAVPPSVFEGPERLIIEITHLRPYLLRPYATNYSVTTNTT